MQEFDIHDYHISACPVCNDPLQEVEKGQICKTCSSRARVRSMDALIHKFVAPFMRENPVAALPLLAFAMTGAEKKFLSSVFPLFKSVSLFGSYGSDHESGVDMRDLSRYAANSFAGVFGSLLFDYFPEHVQALNECFRVITPGGIFLTHIAPFRLLDGDVPPQEKGSVKSRTGYFDYLPEQATLPTVRVGRDWFLKTMEQVGFKPAIVRVHDAVPGLVSEWFIGFKPEKQAVTKPSGGSASDSRVITTRISEVFRSTVPLGDGIGTLVVELLENTSGGLLFREDHLSKNGGVSRELLAASGDGKRLLLSRDLGNTWQQIHPDVQWDSPIRSVFSLADGGRLIRTFSGQMYHLGADGTLISRQSTGSWHWHGSQGIGQSSSGTVMYAEYTVLKNADEASVASVWRYHPDAPELGWHKVLTLSASLRPPLGELRHFHVCCPHPQKPSLWILASGDIGRHCRLWTSADDGDSWQELTVDSIELENMPDQYPKLLRFTSFAALKNGDLLWGTDDVTNSGQAGLFKLRLSGDKPRCTFLGWLGRNCIRNIVDCGNNTFLLISESKHETRAADCILFDADKNRTAFLSLVNMQQKKATVSDSLGSLATSDNTAFFPANGSILIHPEKRCIFRVSIKKKNTSLL